MSLGRRICTVLIIAIIYLSTFRAIPSAIATDYLYKSYEWDYGGRHWTWSINIPKTLYDDYNGVSVSERTKNGPAGYDFLVTTRDKYVVGLANSLHNASTKQGYDAFNEVSFVLSFVQSLHYTSDSVSTGYDEYPRFPVETLVDDGGDCEDTSILFATLILILDYEAIFIHPPEHCAVGVWGTGLFGSYYTYNNKNYYFCETTGSGWNIGDLPSEFNGVSAYLYPIDQSMQYAKTEPNSWQPILWIAFFGICLAAGITYLLSKNAKQKQKGTLPPIPSPPSKI